MGFWHTGYMEFHEPSSEWSGPRPAPRPPEFPCSQCGRRFRTADDLAVHLFDGHVTARPILTLHGRECGRSRLSVITATTAEDWGFHCVRSIRVNGQLLDEDAAKSALTAAAGGVVSVVLEGERVNQEFEFSFSIADSDDLDGVDGELWDLIRGRALTRRTITAFIDCTDRYRTARRYRDGLANYLYGVMAREESAPIAALGGGIPPYVARYDDAVSRLDLFDRPPAEAICGLVAFHYNQFDIALRKTKSPRVARAARRLASLLAGTATSSAVTVEHSVSLDYLLSDTVTERILTWCSIPFDGTAGPPVQQIESALLDQQPADELKLRVVAAEHYLAAGEPDEGRRHLRALRHSAVADRWVESFGNRLTGEPS